MAFRPTLFPVPVAPAIRRWGIRSSSATTGFPTISFPIHRVRNDREFSKAGETTISLNRTICRSILGISIPITAFPGIGATILILRAFSARDRSSERLTILLIFTPGAGSYSNVVITGPGEMAVTIPLTLKSSSVFSSSLAWDSRYSRSNCETRVSGSSRNEMDGSVNPFAFFKDSTCREISS